MHNYSKSQMRRLRELSALLYERELKGSLSSLSHKFDDWKAGKVSSVEMGQLLHEYDYRESRRLWSKYDSPQHHMIVAHAFVKGILTENEIGQDLINELQPAIEFYRTSAE